MITTALALTRWWRLFAGCAALVGGVAVATAAEFSATLTPEQHSRIGLDRLAPAQQASLDRLVARELQAARQGGVRAFAGTFISRRTPAEREAAGLDHLRAAGQNTLNDLVASALAQQQPTPLPVSMLRTPDAETEDAPLGPKVHGEVTLTFGTGRGGSFQAASVYTEVVYPEQGLTLGVGIATFRGHGSLLRRSYYDNGYCRGWGWW